MDGAARTGTTHGDLVKLSELQRSVSVDGGSDVLAVVAVFHGLQLPDAAHVGQSGLNLCHVQHLRAIKQSGPSGAGLCRSLRNRYLDFLRERVQAFP